MSRRILIVEDDPDLAYVVANALMEHGHEVVTASNGQVALEQARALQPDLILLDLNMPVMDGLEFRDQQARDPRVADIPVVVMTAVDAMAVQAMGAGLHDLLIKPVDLDGVVRAVERWVTPATMPAAA